MKSFLHPAIALLAAASFLPAQNTPPAPVPSGAGAVAGSTPPAAAVAAADAGALLDPDVPEKLHQYGLDRYDKIVEKSPFNFKIVVGPSAPTISFATDLSLAGMTRDVGKGIEYATIVDKKKNARFVINNQSPNKEGIQLVRLNRADTLLASTVLARKGSEEHEIKAEKQIIDRKAVVASNGVVRGNPPGATGTPPGGLPPGQRGPGGPGGNNIQQQINNQVQPPTPGPNQPQQLPPAATANTAGGGAQPTLAAQPATVAPTVADQAMQRQNTGGGRRGDGQRGDGQQPQPNRRRVILPPPVATQ